MKVKNKAIYIAAAIAAAVSSVIGGILFAISLNSQFDSNIQHFARGAMMPILAYIFIGLAYAIALGAAVFFTVSKEKTAAVTEDKPQILAVFARFLAALMFIGDFTAIILGSTPIHEFDTISLIMWLSSAAAGVSLLVPVFFKTSPGAKACASLFPIIWGISYMLGVYFAREFAINSPLTSIKILVYGTALVFFLGEARLANKKSSSSIYCFYSIAGLALPAYVIPMAASKDIFMMSLSEIFVLGFAWLYAVSRVIGTYFEPAPIPVPDPEETDDYSESAEATEAAEANTEETEVPEEIEGADATVGSEKAADTETQE